ncbi:MAG: class I SAM-dependent methyltransferase [Planctomycetota bacterium]|nr:class I SAM-dependent methyltransferase [Planctomycetota bacterium]
MSIDRTRALSFDPIAEQYDAVRPAYPDSIIDAALAGLSPGARVLEVGCGTGKATRHLLARGCVVDAVEPGANLAAVARRRAAGDALTVTVGFFEDVAVEPEAYDLVFSAQAFHWVDRSAGYAKAHRALRPGGALGLLWNMHPGTEPGFSTDVRAIYAEHAPVMTDRRHSRSLEERVRERTAEIDATGLFGEVAVHRHRFDTHLDTAHYLGLIATYSDHIALADDARRRLFDGIAELIETCYGGSVTRPYVATLYRARRA